MRFYELEVGGPGAVYPAAQRFRLPFAFPAPVQTAYALLRSFHLQLTDEDSEVTEVSIVLTTHFDPVQSTSSGEVEVEFERTDSSDTGLLNLQSESIEAQIRILVVGI